ncbi:MAG: DUF1592 domain-containing protein [Opitutaceae bacterium]|nr:DUF1592 domain-containing protein [Opitutaceae bacterium]
MHKQLHPFTAPILSVALAAILSLSPSSLLHANPELMEMHCGKCHNDDKLKGDFSLSHLGGNPDEDNAFLWEDSLDYATLEEMPPPEKSELTSAERDQLVKFLTAKVRSYHEQNNAPKRLKPRRLNNRELANSIRDVLMIEDLGTHQPTANLLGDTLHDGFDTNGDVLGLSQFHLEQYITSFRKIVDATILSGKQPATRRIKVNPTDFGMTNLKQRSRDPKIDPETQGIDILDIRIHAYFANFRSAPQTGRYRIKIRATGLDRGRYDSDATGMYPGDPIQLKVHLGDRTLTFDLPDETMHEIELDEWIAAGTKIELSHPTDGLRIRGNGNFKFQNQIAHDYIKETNPRLFKKVLAEEVPKSKNRATVPAHWSHWVPYWQGPRPRLFSAEIEGPIYDSWPPKRQIALLGNNPKAKNAEAILRPIAKRAWRRTIRDGELDRIVKLVQSNAATLGDIEAFKEGIVAILVSPSFLIINPENGEPANRFATKFSYFLKSTTPNERILKAAYNGKLQDHQSIRSEVARHFEQSEADEFLKEFPHAWLQLDRINFMSPDPEHYPLYDRKRLNEDMVAEAIRFFEHAIEQNIPVPELLSADYSFINADLAKVYGIKKVPQDSKLRKHTFKDGRRGGLLGMGAFLTLTADSLGTSPIHRAVYVMENFIGIHPNPPPADVKIEEPDVRQAKTIKEIFAAHTVDENCASCHKAIDPFGYAFENFDPVGAWRDEYTMQIAPSPSKKEFLKIQNEDKRLASLGLPPLPKPWENKPIPVDATSVFRNGTEYQDIIGYRKELSSDNNRDRFVRCFISKLLTYANGEEPHDFWEIQKILERSAESEYRIIDTIAAVIDSPLFREE